MIENELNVFYRDKHVGYLWVNDANIIQFQYSSDWLDDSQRFQISCSLPLTDQAYESDSFNSVAHNFFSNLLPEGNSRRAIERQLKITPNNDFDLLKAIGGECAGALSISYDPIKEASSYRALNEQELHSLLKNQSSRVIINTHDLQQRLSLAGAQDKTALVVKDGKFFLPLNNSPSTHILKFDSTSLKNVPAFETVTTWIAKTLGLNVPDITFNTLGKHRFTLTQRYDRQIEQEQIIRVHQEDFCQALGYSTHHKYEEEKGPTFSECLKLVREKSSYPIIDVRELIRWQVFNFLVGNSDAHAKNISFLYKEKSISVAPFYDLVCTQAFPQLTKNLAMKIGSKNNPGQVNHKAWTLFAEDNKVKAALVLKILEEFTHKIPDAYESVKIEFESLHGPYPSLERIAKVISSNCSIVKNHALK